MSLHMSQFPLVVPYNVMEPRSVRPFADGRDPDSPFFTFILFTSTSTHLSQPVVLTQETISLRKLGVRLLVPEETRD